MMMDYRRVAANFVVIGDRKLHPAVVDISEGRVVNYYEFSDELPMTEWIGGTVILQRDEENILRAYKDAQIIE